MLNTLRTAALQLRRAPWFTMSAGAILVIGLGVNGAMLGLGDAVLFRRPPHVDAPDEVRRLQLVVRTAERSDHWDYPSTDRVAATGAFRGLAQYTHRPVLLGDLSHLQEGSAMLVSPNFFTVLGVKPAMGRLLNHSGQSRDVEVVISHELWRRRFAERRDILGQNLAVTGQNLIVVGVLPSGFTTLQPVPADVFLPIAAQHLKPLLPQNWRTNDGARWVEVVVRLQKGATDSVTVARVGTMLQRDTTLSVVRGDQLAGVGLLSLVVGKTPEAIGGFRIPLALAALAAIVLLVVSANVANLFLVRNSSRQVELQTRVALGITPTAVGHQLVAEALLVTTLSFGGAWLLGPMFSRALLSEMPHEIPPVALGWDARQATILFSCAAIAFLGISASCMASAAKLSGWAGAAVAARGTHRSRNRQLFIGVQTAFSIVLLFFAGAFLSSLRKARGVDLGVDLDRTIQASFQPSGQRVDMGATYQAIAEKLRGNPRVERVALAEANPYSSGRAAGPIADGQSFEDQWSEGESAYITAVGPGFFAAVGARSLRGRDFSETDIDGSQRVAIVNVPLARKLWQSDDPLGRCVYVDDVTGCARVVGVLGGVWKLRGLSRDKMVIYVPLLQARGATPGALLVRAKEDPSTVVHDIRNAMVALGEDRRPPRIIMAASMFDWEIRAWRVGAYLLSIFALIALILAAIGIYSTVAFSTLLRARELGIRLALGSTKSRAARSILKSEAIAVGIGTVAAIIIVALAKPAVVVLLYNTKATDPVILGAAVVVILSAAAMAAATPVAIMLNRGAGILLRAKE